MTYHERSVCCIQHDGITSGILISADIWMHDFDLGNVSSPDVCLAAAA